MTAWNAHRGSYVRVGSTEAVGVCDYSGFWFSVSDLHKQMVWRGNRLVWNGFMVGTPFLDIPNEQSRPPLVSNDPQAVINPRALEGQDNLGAPFALPPSQAVVELGNIDQYEDEVITDPEFNMPILPVTGGPPAIPNDQARLASLQSITWGNSE